MTAVKKGKIEKFCHRGEKGADTNSIKISSSEFIY